MDVLSVAWKVASKGLLMAVMTGNYKVGLSDR